VTVNPLDSIRILSLFILTGMAVQYLAVAGLAWRRLRAGQNGATLSILVNAVALAGLAVAIFLYILLPLPEGVVLLSLFGVLLTNFYLMAALRLEARRPFKKTGSTMHRIYRKIE